MMSKGFSALLSVIIMGVVITMLAVGLLNLGGDSQQISQVLTARYNAKSLSKSCAEKAIAYIRNSDNLNFAESYKARLIIEPSDDTMVYSVNPSYNYGANTSLSLNNQSYILLRFDLASNLPSNSVITSAKLKLFSSAEQPNSAALNLHRIMTANKDWLEGRKSGAAASFYEASWNYLDYGALQLWAGSAGLSTISTDYYAIAESSLAAPLSSSTMYEWSLSSSTVNSWLVAANNAGMILKTTSPYWHWFASKENTNTYQHPQLDLEYTATAYTNDAGGVTGDQGYCFYDAENTSGQFWTIQSTGISHETWSRELVNMEKASTTSAISISSWTEVTSF